TDPLAAALPEEYFFIVLSMVVTGAIAVWRWERIFPDRRDYVNLVPLPIATAKIFLANLVAVILLALILGVDLNLGSALLFPLAVGAAVNSFYFFVHFVAVHALVVTLASFFSFFAVFLIIGGLMSLVPFRVFQRISLYVRSLIVASLVAMLTTSFAVPSGLRHLSASTVRFLPPVWFLGLCQWLHKGPSSALATLGRIALVGLAILLASAVLIYAASYRRSFLRIPENHDLGPIPIISLKFRSLSRLLDGTFLSSPFERAAYWFTLKTLFRSEQHALVLAAFAGFGIVLASQFLLSWSSDNSGAIATLPTPEVLAVPLILAYCISIGLRLAFELPSDLQANWVFRFSVDKRTHECASVGRKIILSLLLPWIFVLVLPLYGLVWGWWVGLLHSFVVSAWSVLLAHILLLRFRKIPFTCPYPAFRDAVVVVAICYFLGFFIFVIMTAQLEYWALLSPKIGLWLVFILASSWYALSRLRQDMPDIDKQVVFDQATPASFELIDLSRGS
ncbi:MAG: hypothetical protein JO356_08640, partial [Acidobacteria bacterium]|nr:hypothetical protein [Acidobacteriota bacterium]